MLMDSGNSSSMQSNSSGGDDQEYDSRSFVPQQQQQTLFSPDPNFLQSFSDFNWPNYTPVPGATSTAAALPPPPPPSPPRVLAPKNPKKRTRASRRAPTTVLTTDTTNFRAMVQEFTGIPAPPFSTRTTTYSRLLGGGGGPFRPAGQRMMSNNMLEARDSVKLPSQTVVNPRFFNNMFSSSLLNIGGQRELLNSGQQLGLPRLPDQSDPFFAFQNLLQQEPQQQQSNVLQLPENPEFNSDNLYSDTNNKD